jgi:xanthine phosphoribosyltransferase
MKEFLNLPVVGPDQALQQVEKSDLSPAQAALSRKLIQESRSFLYRFKDTNEQLLILDVIRFLNHRIETPLMQMIGEELSQKIAPFEPDLILTAPSSGNIPAFATAWNLPTKPPVIYAPKGTPITMKDGEVYQASSRSYTHGGTVDLTVAKECLPSNLKVAICDDFLDTGKTAADLAQIVTAAGSTVVAFFFVIEKPFAGRETLLATGFTNEQIISLITIESMQPGKLKLAGFDSWFTLRRNGNSL